MDKTTINHPFGNDLWLTWGWFIILLFFPNIAGNTTVLNQQNKTHSRSVVGVGKFWVQGLELKSGQNSRKSTGRQNKKHRKRKDANAASYQAHVQKTNVECLSVFF